MTVNVWNHSGELIDSASIVEWCGSLRLGLKCVDARDPAISNETANWILCSRSSASLRGGHHLVALHDLGPLASTSSSQAAFECIEP